MKNAVMKIVDEVAPKVNEKYNIDLKHKLSIEISSRMTRTWGFAQWKGFGVNRLFKIKIAKKIFDNATNTNAFRDVVLHEIAHIIDYKLNEASSGHGYPWRSYAKFLGARPEKFVSEDSKKEIAAINTVYATGKINKRYVHRCSCKEHSISGIIHNRIMKGSIYRCRLCKTTISKEFRSA